jgi:hypothetical protein
MRRRRRPGARLSMETRSRGPLVAQTSIGRQAQPCGAPVRRWLKVPANEAVRWSSSSGVVVPDSACHAGGRGFESRRSRKNTCKSAPSVAGLGAQDRRPSLRPRADPADDACLQAFSPSRQEVGVANPAQILPSALAAWPRPEFFAVAGCGAFGPLSGESPGSAHRPDRRGAAPRRSSSRSRAGAPAAPASPSGSGATAP